LDNSSEGAISSVVEAKARGGGGAILAHGGGGGISSIEKNIQ